MNPSDQDIARLYAEALRGYLTGAGEEALHQAYEVGRVALSQRLGVVDVVLVHHRALLDAFAQTPIGERTAMIAPAADFLAECLSPFEMMLRGYQETNARLGASNADLTAANAALAAAHQALKAEVAERERAEAALVHAQKLQAVGLLAGGVAHHFNNLLTVILGNLQLATRHLGDGQDISRFLGPATIAAERGAQVVRQLLTFSRQQVLKAQVVEVASLLEATRPLLAGALRGDIAVQIEVAAGVSAIRIDPSQLELALLNLAVNARDAMPAGGALRISAENRRVKDERLGLEGDFVVIAVADTGEGIDAQIAQRVFEPFFSTKPLGPGAGLGLSQVHGFVHQSGGGVDLESVVGEGTTFRLYFPPAQAVAEIANPEVPPLQIGADGSGSVLVVDDDVAVADLAGQLLEDCGYAVRLVHRGSAALDLLSAGEPFDLVFSDIIMPGMSGVQLAEELRRRFPKLPILLTTGYSEAMPAAQAHGLPVITKPYNARVLCDRVGELMRAGAD